MQMDTLFRKYPIPMANQNFDPDLSVDALKRLWRKRLKKIRQGLDSDRRTQASSLACQKLKEWTQSADLILSFASTTPEINLWPLNEELASAGRLVLPRLVEKELCLFHVMDIQHLESHSWGFLEPHLSHCSPIDFSLIKIALIPGLGFDLQTKHRLGYGQGYYDRLLASSSFPQSWGIGFLEQAVENLPHTDHDIALKQIYLF